MVQRSGPREPVDWPAIIKVVVVILLIAGVFTIAISAAVKNIMDSNRRENAAYDLLYESRCKELGGVKSSTKAEVCIVGDKLYTVRPNNYKERILYVFY